MKKFVKISSCVLLVLSFILVITFMLTKFQGGTPSLFGYQILRISSSSMSPKLEVSDIILSKNVSDYSTIKLGDIVTYKGEVGNYSGKLITHEIVVEPYLEADDKYYMQTKGFANFSADPIISQDQVTGLMICKVPVLTAMYNFYQSPWGIVLILGVLLLLFISETLNLINLFKDKDNGKSYKHFDDNIKDK